MGGSISVRNDLDLPVHVALSHIGPLHYKLYLQPGHTHTWNNIGIVWFTMQVFAGSELDKRNVNELATVKSFLQLLSAARRARKKQVTSYKKGKMPKGLLAEKHGIYANGSKMKIFSKGDRVYIEYR